MNNKVKSNSKFKAHTHLMDLIKNRFNVVLEAYHDRNDFYINNSVGGEYRAVTVVEAYPSILDCHNRTNLIAEGTSACSWNDQFVRAKGLEIAARRLYRKLNALNK